MLPNGKHSHCHWPNTEPLRFLGSKPVGCALFGVEVASLFHAMQDPANLQFVFVSDSSVPLKPFAYVHKELALNSPETSKICLASGAYFNKAKTEFCKAGSQSSLRLPRLPSWNQSQGHEAPPVGGLQSGPMQR